MPKVSASGFKFTEFLSSHDKVLPHHTDAVVIGFLLEGYLSSFLEHAAEIPVITQMRLDDGKRMNGT